MYRGPIIITVMDRPDLVRVKDLITNQESVVHASSLRPFKHPKDMISLVAANLDEFHVEKLLGILLRARIQGNTNSELVGVDMSQRTILWWTGRRSIPSGKVGREHQFSRSSAKPIGRF